MRYSEMLSGLRLFTEDGGAPAGGAGNEPAEFDADAWYDGLDDETRAAVERYHTATAAKLQSALDAERAQRKTLAKELKEAAKKGGDATEFETRLKELSDKAAEAELRATFTADAVDQGVPVKRVAALMKVARVDGAIDDVGSVDWDKLREEYSEFFPVEEKKAPARANGGAGVGTQPAKKEQTVSQRMNGLIRARGR